MVFLFVCHASLLALHAATCMQNMPEGVLWKHTWWKEPLEKVGPVIGWTFRKWRPPPLRGWVNFFGRFWQFWQFWRILKCSWSLIVDHFVWDLRLFSIDFLLKKSLLTPRACGIILLHQVYQPPRRSDNLRWCPHISQSIPDLLAFKGSRGQHESAEGGTPIEIHHLFIWLFS